MLLVVFAAVCLLVTLAYLRPGRRSGKQAREFSVLPVSVKGNFSRRATSSGAKKRELEGIDYCALQYCDFYEDAKKEACNGRCRPSDAKSCAKHWLLHGKRRGRDRCGSSFKICDSVWRGDFGNYKLPKRVDIVVAHCKEDMSWLNDYINELKKITPVKKVTIVSKCGFSVHTAPKNSRVIRVENVGRCDHTYAMYMAQHVLQDQSIDNDAAVMFVKGGAPMLLHRSHLSTRKHKKGEGFMPILRPIDYWLKITGATGFACLVEHFPTSIYHNGTVLGSFFKTDYTKHDKSNKDFKSNFSNLSQWLAWSENYAHAILPRLRDVVPVCYEGNFVARVQNIRRQSKAWKIFEEVLSRGNNIEEGHFMERTWAMLLKDEPGNMTLQVPHHAAHISKSRRSTLGRYAKCMPQYLTTVPVDIDKD